VGILDRSELDGMAGSPPSSHSQRIGVAVSHAPLANDLVKDLVSADLDPQTVTSPTEAGAPGLVG
jgi:hypothetical protein